MNSNPTVPPSPSRYQKKLTALLAARPSPCDLVYELVANSRDANATHIWILPHPSQKGVIVCDDGRGISHFPSGRKGEHPPYASFFTIGRSNKFLGKGLASKLAFAGDRFALMTNCRHLPPEWMVKLIKDPQEVLFEQYSLAPSYTYEPWKVIEHTLAPYPDACSQYLTKQLSQDYFKQFSSGSIISVQGLPIPDYDKYFSLESPETSKVYQHMQAQITRGWPPKKWEESGTIWKEDPVIDSRQDVVPEISILTARGGNFELERLSP